MSWNGQQFRLYLVPCPCHSIAKVLHFDFRALLWAAGAYHPDVRNMLSAAAQAAQAARLDRSFELQTSCFSIGSQLRAANLLFFRLDRNILLQTSCFSIGSQVRAASLMLFRLDRSLELQASCFSIGSGLRAAPRVFPNRPTTLCNPSAASSQGVGGKGGSL